MKEKIMSTHLSGTVTTPAFRAGLSSSQSVHTQQLIALERALLDGWIKGNPDPNLAICTKDITYTDTGVGRRLDGLAETKTYFEAYRGKSLFDSYEILNPLVHDSKDMAVLVYRLLSHNGAETVPYDCTEVYQKRGENWMVIHSHFSKGK
jgi:hypothetical protein